MADEAFALSPISARAAEPREEDYDAISAAFMETSRGRWFLGEYAKRNRNADTRMVLDAVARIEHNIAAQRQAPPDNRLAETLTAIRAAVDSARSAAFDVLGNVGLEEKLIPLRKGARIIHEIAWRWREIGADGRICDLLDAQVSAIEASCAEITSLDARTALNAAFELIQRNIEEKIEGLANGEAKGNTSAAPTADVRSPPPPSAPIPAEASDETTAPSAPMAATAATNVAEAISAETDLAEAASVAQIASDANAEAADTRDDSDNNDYDEAVLDAVALEMAIADPIEPERVTAAAERAAPAVGATAEFNEIDDVEVHFVDSPDAPSAGEPAPAAQQILLQQPTETQRPAVSHERPTLQETIVSPESPAAPESQPVVTHKPEAAAVMEMTQVPAIEIPSKILLAKLSREISFEAPSFEAPSDMPGEISLGSSLIASGIVKKPGNAPASDPMAAIRRLSQAEKIALFS